MDKTLIVILGPTGVGKTELSLSFAEHFGSPIISADSRQIYREIPVGTAAPTAEEQQRVKHWFVGTHALSEDYNAGQYERDCVNLLNELFQTHDVLVMTGGSMMYIDAVCKGLDDIPSVLPEIRQKIRNEYLDKGLTWVREQVAKLDPEYYAIADQQNPQRLLHALEICLTTGDTYSHYRKGTTTVRPFRILKIGLSRNREVLYERINQRVEQMLAMGLEEEARNVYDQRNCNSLNTVGYKEMFNYFDGNCSLEEAISLIKQNSRHYAKRQMTWFRRDKDIHWFDLDKNEKDAILCDVGNLLAGM